jgi:hypothetical protein
MGSRFSLSDAALFNVTQTKAAIMASKASKACGPEGIFPLHLKHLGSNDIHYLTCLFNLSMSTSIIPDIWKKSTIIPLLKPGKPAGDSKSYRPVSLLYPAIKMLERLLLPELNKCIVDKPFQHGFRSQHSTVSALLDLNLAISNGINQRHRTVLLQLDLSKAFDMVKHDERVKLLAQFCNYLHNRTSPLLFRGFLLASTQCPIRGITGCSLLT